MALITGGATWQSLEEKEVVGDGQLRAIVMITCC